LVTACNRQRPPTRFGNTPTSPDSGRAGNAAVEAYAGKKGTKLTLIGMEWKGTHIPYCEEGKWRPLKDETLVGIIGRRRCRTIPAIF
jgi:hypothetical protein